MGSSGLFEKRFRPRKMLTGLLPGPLVDESGEKINCKPVDISTDGLGIISKSMLTTEQSLVLKTQKAAIELTITYVKPDFGKQNLYRYGLKLVDPTINLEEFFISAGCLK